MENSNPMLPPAWEKGKRCYSSGLTLATARKMLEAAEKEADKQGVPMVIAIADAGGNLLALHRMDDAMLCSIQIAMDKAFTAVFGKLPTQSWCDIYQAGALPSLFYHERWIAFPGGFPIIKDGKLLGGVGASGGVEREDTYVARAALKAGGFNTDDADAIIAKLEGAK